MAPPRETNARGSSRDGAALFAGVEEDVEKKRHVKDPFRDAYVALVAAPFDAFLAKRSAPGDDGDVDMDGGDDDREEERDGRGVDDSAALQQGVGGVYMEALSSAGRVANAHMWDDGEEISARSQQVHLRLEILRRQMLSLVEETSAVLESGAVAPKDSTKKKKAPKVSDSCEDEPGDDSIINLEKLLERAALYETGEMTDLELQNTWTRHDCSCDKHEIDGADAELKSMREAVDEAFESVREHNRLYFGPRLSVDLANAGPVSSELNDDMIQFLEDCKRSIKPFFIEDFVHFDDEESQPVQDVDNHLSRVDFDDTPNQDMSLPEMPQEQEDVTMNNEVVVDDQNNLNALVREDQSATNLANSDTQNSQRETTSTQAIESRPPRFCVKSVRANRQALHKDALNIKLRYTRSNKLPNRNSYVSFDAAKTPHRSLELIRNPKTWHNLSMSVIDSSVNLVELRNELSKTLDEPLDEEEALETFSRFDVESATCNGTSSAQCDLIASPLSPTSQIPMAVPLSQGKRQLDIAEAPRQKKLRANTTPNRQPSLRELIHSIRDIFRHVSETSCVSYLSTLLRSGMTSGAPQRTFVALVFSASLANTTPESPDNRADKPLRVTLQSTNAGRDVKIVCCQE